MFASEFYLCVLRVCIFHFSSKTNFANSFFSHNIVLFYGIGKCICSLIQHICFVCLVGSLGCLTEHNKDLTFVLPFLLLNGCYFSYTIAFSSSYFYSYSLLSIDLWLINFFVPFCFLSGFHLE